MKVKIKCNNAKNEEIEILPGIYIVYHESENNAVGPFDNRETAQRHAAAYNTLSPVRTPHEYEIVNHDDPAMAEVDEHSYFTPQEEIQYWHEQHSSLPNYDELKRRAYTILSATDKPTSDGLWWVLKEGDKPEDAFIVEVKIHKEGKIRVDNGMGVMVPLGNTDMAVGFDWVKANSPWLPQPTAEDSVKKEIAAIFGVPVSTIVIGPKYDTSGATTGRFDGTVPQKSNLKKP